MTKLTRNLTKFKVKKNNEVINLIKQNYNHDWRKTKPERFIQELKRRDSWRRILRKNHDDDHFH